MLGNIIGGALPGILSWGAKKLANTSLGSKLGEIFSPNMKKALKQELMETFRNKFMTKKNKTKGILKEPKRGKWKKGKKHVSFD